MAPFPTVFTLWNIRVHVGITNGSNILSNIEASVDDRLGGGPILWVLDVNPNSELDATLIICGFDMSMTSLKMCIYLKASLTSWEVIGLLVFSAK